MNAIKILNFGNKKTKMCINAIHRLKNLFQQYVCIISRSTDFFNIALFLCDSFGFTTFLVKFCYCIKLQQWRWIDASRESQGRREGAQQKKTWQKSDFLRELRRKLPETDRKNWVWRPCVAWAPNGKMMTLIIFR